MMLHIGSEDLRAWLAKIEQLVRPGVTLPALNCRIAAATVKAGDRPEPWFSPGGDLRYFQCTQCLATGADPWAITHTRNCRIGDQLVARCGECHAPLQVTDVRHATGCSHGP